MCKTQNNFNFNAKTKNNFNLICNLEEDYLCDFVFKTATYIFIYVYMYINYKYI